MQKSSNCTEQSFINADKHETLPTWLCTWCPPSDWRASAWRRELRDCCRPDRDPTPGRSRQSPPAGPGPYRWRSWRGWPVSGSGCAAWQRPAWRSHPSAAALTCPGGRLVTGSPVRRSSPAGQQTGRIVWQNNTTKLKKRKKHTGTKLRLLLNPQ